MSARPLLLAALALALACDRPAIPDGLTGADLELPAHPAVTPPTLPPGIRVRALTLNLHGGEDATPEAIAATLRSVGADLVGLTECPDDLGQRLATLAGYAHAEGEGEVILSRTELSGFAQVELASGRSFAHAETLIGGVTFSVYAAHLGWNVAGLRQHREFTDRYLATDPRAHLVLMGDFNDEHLSKQIGVLEEQVADAWTALGWLPGERISWPAAGFDGSEGSQLIDLIFFKRALPALVLDGDVLNVVPPLSDHKPAWADLLYPAGDAPFAQDPFAGRGDRFAELPPEAQRPPNLLANPGAEDGLAGWEAHGDAAAVAVRSHRLPRTGARFFTGTPSNQDAKARLSWATQLVDLSAHAEAIEAGRGRLYAAAWLSTGFQIEEEGGLWNSRPRPYCDAEVAVELLDEHGHAAERVGSGRRDTLGWTPWSARIPIPPGVRAARFTWWTHQKFLYGDSNDGAVDDLYLGWSEAEGAGAPARNLLADWGAELGGGTWAMHGFEVMPDLRPAGTLILPPWSWSGGALFHAGGVPGVSDGLEGDSKLAQLAPLPSALYAAVDREELAVRWGGRVRTLDGRAPVRLSLELSDESGATRVTLVAPAVDAPEWTLVERRARLPAGTTALRLVLRAAAHERGSGAYADELFVRPEKR